MRSLQRGRCASPGTPCSLPLTAEHRRGTTTASHGEDSRACAHHRRSRCVPPWQHAVLACLRSVTAWRPHLVVLAPVFAQVLDFNPAVSARQPFTYRRRACSCPPSWPLYSDGLTGCVAAAGQIGYALAPSVARGAALGTDQPVILHLLDIPPAAESLKGVRMELIDSAYPLLQGAPVARCRLISQSQDAKRD